MDFSWQARFYDRIIQDEKSLENIRTYIVGNPIKWTEDEYFSDMYMVINEDTCVGPQRCDITSGGRQVTYVAVTLPNSNISGKGWKAGLDCIIKG